jgi:hypothetical protein
MVLQEDSKACIVMKNTYLITMERQIKKLLTITDNE